MLWHPLCSVTLMISGIQCLIGKVLVGPGFHGQPCLDVYGPPLVCKATLQQWPDHRISFPLCCVQFCPQLCMYICRWPLTVGFIVFDFQMIKKLYPFSRNYTLSVGFSLTKDMLYKRLLSCWILPVRHRSQSAT